MSHSGSAASASSSPITKLNNRTSSYSFLQWLRRKRYQYEVTFSLYMLTPTEKFIFNSFLFLFLSMIVIAASLYLPEHIAMMASRAWFYYAGEEGRGAMLAQKGVGRTGSVSAAAVNAASSNAGGGGPGGGYGQGVLDMLGDL